MLAHLVIARLATPGLLEHQAQAGGQLLPAGGDVGQGVAPCIGQDFQPLHAQYRVLHGAACLAQLGVRNAGVDQYQVADSHGEALMLELKAASTGSDEEQFGTGMGVDGTVPLLAVLGAGNIQQLGLILHRRRLRLLGENMMTGAHGARTSFQKQEHRRNRMAGERCRKIALPEGKVL